MITERIGYERLVTVLNNRIRQLRPLYAPANRCQRAYFEPGEPAQWDPWFPPADVLGFGGDMLV